MLYKGRSCVILLDVFLRFLPPFIHAEHAARAEEGGE